jgi:hypothetical protein
MTENDLKNVIYGGIRELLKDRNYYYDGYKGHWTEDGKRVIVDMMDIYAEKIIEAVRHADEQRSKDLVIKGLKGEKI